MGYHLHEKLIEKLEDFKKNDLSAYKEEKKPLTSQEMEE